MNKEIYAVLCEMTDKEFLTFIKNKYGSKWLFCSLSLEEVERYIPAELPDDDIPLDPMSFAMKKLPKW